MADINTTAIQPAVHHHVAESTFIFMGPSFLDQPNYIAPAPREPEMFPVGTIIIFGDESLGRFIVGENGQLTEIH